MSARPLLMALSLIPATANAATVLDLEPTGKWLLNYEDNSCFLGRTFGEGDSQITIAFTRFAPGDGFSLRAYGKPFRNDGPFQDVRVAFGAIPATEPLRDSLSGKTGKVPFVDLGRFTLATTLHGVENDPPSLSAEQEAAVSALTIGPHRGKIYRLHLGSMRSPMRAMRSCTDNLVRTWGYDPSVTGALSKPPEPASYPGSWLTTDDYPAGMVATGQLGAVEFRLDVDENGGVTGCTILRRAGDETFAATSCMKLKRRARFNPALDNTGRPVRSFYINRVNWILPH